ncbi:MAG: FAD-dependent oxidoreductase [Planctomycetes bacterium]|nr:FAD-dependent oxidoreductase [Planctomycetota bacterium]
MGTSFRLLWITVAAFGSPAEAPPQAEATGRLFRLGLLDVTGTPYRADPTGVDDATRAIQRAVDDARDRRLVCFFPPGTYRISDTLSCEQKVRKLDTPRFVEGGKRADYWHIDRQVILVGSTKGDGRPVLKLSEDAEGFDDPAKPKIAVHVWAHTWYGDGTGEQSNISFNHIFKGIDIDIRGHAGAIGIRHSGSQGSTLQDVTIRAEGAFAGMNNCCGQGGGTYGVEVSGGRYGIVIEPSSRFPLLTSCVFKGQTEAAITYARGGSQVPALFVGCLFEPEGGAVVDFTTQRSYAGIGMVDCAIELERGGVIARTKRDQNIFIEDTYVRGARSVASGGARILPPDRWMRIGRYSSHADRCVNLIDGIRSSGEIAEWGPADEPPSHATLRLRHYESGPSFEDPDAVDVGSFGAEGNGKTDDTRAFERAIAAGDKVFIPKGTYRLRGTLRLGPRTHLFGLGRTFCSIGGDEEDAFSLATADDPNAAPGLSFLAVRGRIEWRSGRGTCMLASGSLAVSGHGGGRLYGVMAMRRPFVLEGTREPLSFYALNIERVLTNPQSEIRDCSHLRIYYFKVEAGTIDRPNAGDANTPCRIAGSQDIRVYCMYGNVRKLEDRPMLEIADSTDVVVSQLKAFAPGGFPHLRETSAGKEIEIPSTEACALFVRGPEGRRASVLESAREIPVAEVADIVVVGGSTGAVSAACEAARSGARVFLAAPRPYLGEDMCATLRLWLEPDERPASPLGRALFEAGSPATPLHVKRTLDEALLRAGVRFLYGCCATDVLRDARGNPAGIVMADRAGRQAIEAKIVIDATERAAVARLAGARFCPYPPGPHAFERVVIGGRAVSAEGVGARTLEAGFGRYGMIEYTLTIPMAGGDVGSFARAEQIARDKTFDGGMVEASESLFQIPPDSMEARARGAGEWPGAGRIDLDAFRPAGVERLYVLGGCAGVSRPAAERLLRPLALIDVGARLGRRAAEEARAMPAPEAVRVPGGMPQGRVARGEVREILSGVRPFREAAAVIRSETHALPVLGAYDVVVVGGGTSGAPAAIASARQGAGTLVIERLHALGGVGTLGMIVNYWNGNRVGFHQELEAGIRAVGASERGVAKAESLRRAILGAGGDIWFNVLGCGALVEGRKVCGVAVATPQGRGIVLAKVVIDSTANADIAAAAGAPCMTTDAGDITMQMAGLPYRDLGVSQVNTAYTFADDTDMVGLRQLMFCAKERWAGHFDLGQLVQTRERRRIIGDIVLTPIDQYAGRTFADTIVRHESNYDKYNFAAHPLYLLRNPDKGVTFSCDLPYRCLLPRGLDGILVTGLGASADRDAMPVVRVQPDLHNQGYAAGMAAAMAAKSGKPTREIDIRALQRHLVEKGNLPASVLDDRDSFPVTRERLAAAVEDIPELHLPDIATVLAADREAALEALRAAYARAPEEKKLPYARVLGVLGDATGGATLTDAVARCAWDSGENLEPFGNRGALYSEVDLLIIALGRSRARGALEPILEKLTHLDPGSAYSHHRAVALALEALGDRSAAPALARLLREPGMRGHTIATLEAAEAELGAGGTRSVAHLNEALREIVLARALHRCGDHEGLAREILEEYAKDLRGHFARHARAILEER